MKNRNFCTPPKKNIWKGECTIPMAKTCQQSKFLEETSFGVALFCIHAAYLQQGCTASARLWCYSCADGSGTETSELRDEEMP